MNRGGAPVFINQSIINQLQMKTHLTEGWNSFYESDIELGGSFIGEDEEEYSLEGSCYNEDGSFTGYLCKRIKDGREKIFGERDLIFAMDE